jgi:hypothetical protein
VARGSRLFVGDALCSVSVIDLIETEGGDSRLKSVAKDFSPLWPVTVESLDRDTIIGANVSRPLQQLEVFVIYLVLRWIATFSPTRFNKGRTRRFWSAMASGTLARW